MDKSKLSRVISICGMFGLFLFQNCGGFQALNTSPSVSSSFSVLPAPGSTGSTPPATTTPLPVVSGANVLPVTVGSCGDAVFNNACVSVTVCTPGTTQCQTIPNIRISTQSTGLRIFSGVLTIPLIQETDANGNDIAECEGFVDSYAWGPVKAADIILGQEKASNIPIQVVDNSFASSSICATIYPGLPAFEESGNEPNGVLGLDGYNSAYAHIYTWVGAPPANQFWDLYAACASGSSCQWFDLHDSAQGLQNPVSHLPVDNNGIIMTFPAITNDQASQISGYLILGIGTESNNSPAAGITTFPASPDFKISGNFAGSSYSVVLDSGTSNRLPSTSILPDCTGAFDGYFCPISPATVSLALSGTNGSPVSTVSLLVGNASTQLNSSNPNNVFDDIGGAFGEGSSSQMISLGIPFFIGRTIYFGYSGASTPLGTGPFYSW